MKRRLSGSHLYLDIDGVLNSPSGVMEVELDGGELIKSVTIVPEVIASLRELDNVSFCSVWRSRTEAFAAATGLPEWDWLDFEIEWSLRSDSFRRQVVASKVGAALADMEERKIKRGIFIDDWAHFIPFGILERAESRGLDVIPVHGHTGLDAQSLQTIIERLENHQ